LPRYSRLVPVAEISDPKNDYNLNLPRYIDSTEPEDIQDIDGHLRGGIPNRDIDGLEEYWEVFPAVENIHDLVNVLLAEAVLVAVFDKALGGVDHENALAGGGAFFVKHDYAGWDARAVEEVWRQTDDALEVASLDQVAPDCPLGSPSKQHAVREDTRAFAGAFERAKDVQEISVIPLLAGRDAVVEALPGVVFGIEAGAPTFVAEGRIGDDIIERLESIAFEEERTGKGVALSGD
jgi:hypothetical protein